MLKVSDEEGEQGRDRFHITLPVPIRDGRGGGGRQVQLQGQGQRRARAGRPAARLKRAFKGGGLRLAGTPDTGDVQGASASASQQRKAKGRGGEVR